MDSCSGSKELLQDIEELDSKSERESFKISVIYSVSEKSVAGCDTIRFVKSKANIELSSKYLNFLTQLGWIINVNHPDEPIDNGQKQFARKCSVCHTLTPSSKRRAGPTLYGVFGRKVGAVEDYPYSQELLEMELVWNEDTIDLLFKEGPDVVTPGSKMPVQRIKGEQDRADLISYLKRATEPQ